MAQRDRRPDDKIASLDRRSCIIGCYTGTQLGDFADALMSQDDRKGHLACFPGQDVDVAATDTAQYRPDQRASRLGRVDLDVPCLKSVLFNEHCSFTVHGLSSR